MIGSKNFEIGPNEFLAGATSSASTSDGGFSNETRQVNITAKPGVLYAPGNYTNRSTNLADEIIASCEDNDFVGKNRMFLDASSNLYSYNGTALTLEDDATDGIFAQGTTDMVAWYDDAASTPNFYMTTKAGDNGDIVKWNGTSTLDESWWITTLGKTKLSQYTPWRPLLVYEKNLYIGDRNQLHRIAPDLTVSVGILTLADGEMISSLGIDQGTGRMLIATSNGANLNASGAKNTRIMLYDGYSNKVSRVVPVSGLVTAFKSVGNTTFIFFDNRLGYWTGSGIEFLRTLNFAKGTTASLIYPHRTCSLDNTLYWVDTAKDGTYNANCQIMAYGEVINGNKIFYPVMYPAGAYTTSKSMTCLAPVSSTKLGFSYETPKFYDFDLTDIATIGTGGASIDFFSKRYDFPKEVTINGLLWEFDQKLPTGDSNIIGIRIVDSDGTETTLPSINPGARADMHSWESTYPTINTRSFQLKFGMLNKIAGVRRVTVFYTPKE